MYLPATLTEEIECVENHVGDLRGEPKEAEEVVSVRPCVCTCAVSQLVVCEILKKKDINNHVLIACLTNETK